MMDEINWRRIDLNLLVSFRALYQHRHVTKAAAMMHLGQSAMSHNLAKLRTLFADPLFVRQGQQMQPTQRANELAVVIDQLLGSIAHELLNPSQFEPSQYRGQFRIGLTDYAELIFAPQLFDRLAALAPHSQLVLRHVDRANFSEMLSEGTVDLVLGGIAHSPEFAKQGIACAHLYHERHLCLFDAHACELDGCLTLAQFAAIPHALVSPEGRLETAIDQRLQALGLHRRVQVCSRHFQSVAQLLQGRKLIATVAELMVKQANLIGQLQVCEPPLAVDDFEVLLLSRLHDSKHPRLQWLSSQVTELVQAQVKQLKAQ
ncbi:Nodulation protein D 2 [Vibrio stylophorae]|uniref:Nodulation protein D 2 n=1 Tax=Vibrio stylophorae TaxID=659351 RepID=A0ABM8ZQS1_9VIBR|nr:LysR family transcriptional regulator [Vibrio stylophorae]CAH0532624.1 Nodulation protein D 2 [Vibrio stylophorae]